ncbi:MAG: chitobiase/beta-hexosaminidase C-terminal domain-containing protein, partial [Planctomycetota bacterium]
MNGDYLIIDSPNTPGNIYYTLDGSDPRQPVSGNAIGTKYTNQITLNKSTRVKARVLDGITWSALNEAIFAVDPVVENLRITEIMYHPLFTGNINDPNKE